MSDRQTTPEPSLAETLDRFIAAAGKVNALAERCRSAALMARPSDEMEIERLRAANEVLRSECARWRAAAIKAGHRGYLTDGE